MDILTDTPLLKFNANTLEDVRKEFNLHHKGALDQMLSSFEDWISKQIHFTKKTFDRHYLENMLIQCKGSLERAKNTLDKLCTLKTLLPHFFSKPDAKNDLMDISKFLIPATMPILLKNNYRLFILKIVSADFDSNIFLDFQRFSILMCEYTKFNDYFLGLTILIDCRHVNLIKAISNINIMDLRNTMSILIEGYGMRINGIHLLSSSKSIELLVNILKQVISAKIGDRITVHDKVESLYKHISKEVLPEEYGGEEKPLKSIHDDWVNVLGAEDNVSLLKDICQANTEEKSRLAAKYNDQILGTPGSFRKLTLD